MRIVIIAICMIFSFFFLFQEVWADEINPYKSIVEMLQINDCPYPNPSNLQEANSNASYIAQNIKAIQAENREWVEKVKRGIYAERKLGGIK